MKKLLLVFVAISSFATQVCAQQVVGFILNGGVGTPVAVSTANPLPVSASVSASIAPFTPTSATSNATINVTNASSATALPTGVTQVVTNSGSKTAYISLSIGAGTATTAGYPVAAGSTVTFAPGTATFINAITAGTDTTTLNVSGGSGSFQGAGGGTSTSGGGASYTSAASPFSVTAGTNKPAGISTSNSAQWMVPVKPGTTTEIDLSSPSGIKGADGTNIVSSSNPLPVAQVTSSAIIGGVRLVNGASQDIACNLHAFYDASDNGSKTIVAGTSSKKIFICGFILATGGTATNLSLTSGTGTDCVTTSVNITPAYQLVANDKIGANAPFWNGLITLANADNLCVKASGANAHQAEVWYSVQ